MSEKVKDAPKEKHDANDADVQKQSDSAQSKLAAESEGKGTGKEKNERSAKDSEKLAEQGAVGRLTVQSGDKQGQGHLDVLKNPESSAEDKIKAAHAMAFGGQKSFSGEDGRSFEIHSKDFGKRTGVVVSTRDQHGNFEPVLRGVVDNDGNVKHQKDSRGNDVEFKGDKASKHLGNDPVLKTGDPAKAKEDPAKAKEDPAKAKEDPAKVKEDPAKAKEDPAKDAAKPGEDPAKAKEDPAKAKEDPAKAKEDPAKAKEDPAKVGEDPAKAKEDPAKAKEDPAKAKEDPAKAADPTKKEWTIAVELGASGPATEHFPKGNGSEPLLEQLKGLAKETENKSVDFVVAAERPTDKKGNLCHNETNNPAKVAACDMQALQSGSARTERYFIHDGKIDKLPDSKASTPGKEIEELLKDAGKLAPSNKLGLVVQGIQQGADNSVATNKDLMSLPQMVDGIKKGLQGGEHKKLDLLNFDVCSMSSPHTLGKVKDVAENVVASSAIEKITLANDGQNLGTEFRSLMNNPSQSGRDFAKNIVDLASKGANGAGEDNATLTLAAFDMSKYGDFKRDFDQLGAQLNRGMHDKSSEAGIRKAVDGSPVAPDGAREDQSHIRDLKSFAQNLLTTFSGKDPEIERAAASLIKSYDAMAVAQFGEPKQGQDGIGGLGFNMPGKEIQDKSEFGRIASPLRKMQTDLKESEGLSLDGQGRLVKELKAVVDHFPKSKETEELQKTIGTIGAARNDQELGQRIKQMIVLLREQEQTEQGKALAKGAERGFAEARREHQGNRNFTSLGRDWDGFVKQLDR